MGYNSLMSSRNSLKRIRVIFSGRVQGVGFRYSTVSLAEHLAVSGFVRNLWDGDVELVAEGSEQELLKLVNDIRASRLGRYILHERLSWFDATGEFEGFQVRY